MKIVSRSLSSVLLMVICVSMHASVSLAQDWPVWRGPTLDGHAPKTASGKASNCSDIFVDPIRTPGKQFLGSGSGTCGDRSNLDSVSHVGDTEEQDLEEVPDDTQARRDDPTGDILLTTTFLPVNDVFFHELFHQVFIERSIFTIIIFR